MTATALAANPDFAGVWCQGGTDGVVRAFLDAGVPLVPVAGEAENGFRKQMLEYKDQFQGYSIGQTPGLVCVSMRAALSLLMGEPVPQCGLGAAAGGDDRRAGAGRQRLPGRPGQLLHRDLHPGLRREPHLRGGRRAAGLGFTREPEQAHHGACSTALSC